MDATDAIAHLLSRFMHNVFFQFEPNENEKGEYHTPRDQSWSCSSCQIHTDSKFLYHKDLGSSWYDHPIVYNTADNKKILANVLAFVGQFTMISNWVVIRIMHSGCTASDTLVEMARGNMPTTLE